MGGLDELLAGFSDGATLPVVLLAAVLLGVRHATDPDHVLAVAALVAGSRRNARSGARLGLAWGIGHGVTLLVLGTPLILFGSALPGWAQRTAEAAVGLVIAVLAVRLLLRWRAGAFHVHVHDHDGDVRHAHLHSHALASGHEHEHGRQSGLGALGIGIAHGAGGSAGVGLLLVASIHSQAVALAALVLLAFGTAITMAALSSWLGVAVLRWHAHLPAPLGAASLGFGVWYLLGALSLLAHA